MTETPAEYWNHNTHYHRVVLRNVPRGCGEALDVGCGDGLLARRLAPRAGHVTGLDRSAEMVVRAKTLSEGVGNVDFVEAGLLEYDLPERHYDFVCCVAAIHHMDFAAGLAAMRDAVRPGGALVVIGLANNAGLKDLIYSAAGVPGHVLHRRVLKRGSAGEPGAPLADPDMTWGEVRDGALRLLPGAVFRRHLLWRYSIVWHRAR
ncbi:methyltransferase domain-containing protein [Actinomadura sp. LD22]|uniref:Methyltransferase domain-containing protein n=1 Tax=Actinomadura physcomitrii TaxID=2650748 RepID=A0A6I4MDD6_9ACTN|nr:class I SAM-dependent methyltransferase [Actinomadura physcomitrii]MWA02264.1 methyltransferase domain-containing protein [Actinomadura physcomitrii]